MNRRALGRACLVAAALIARSPSALVGPECPRLLIWELGKESDRGLHA